MKRYQLGAHTKHDSKVHLVWIPKYRKKVLTGQVALRVRDLIRQIAMEHEVTILSGKVASDHIHVLVAYKPHVDVGMIVQWLKGISSRILLQEFAHLRKHNELSRRRVARAPKSGTVCLVSAIGVEFVEISSECEQAIA